MNLTGIDFFSQYGFSINRATWHQNMQPGKFYLLYILAFPGTMLFLVSLLAPS